MKVIFIGCVESSMVFLKILLEEKSDVVGVITKAESKCNSDFVDLSDIAIQNKILYLYVKNINDNKTPHNRGKHPLIWSLALGLEETASSFFVLDENADTGNVVSQKRVPILYEDTARTLYDRVMNIASIQLKELWNDIREDCVTIIEDEGQKGNTWRKRSKDDRKIDWRMSGRSIYNLEWALSEPYVGAHFEYNGCKYKVWETLPFPRSIDAVRAQAIFRGTEPGALYAEAFRVIKEIA